MPARWAFLATLVAFLLSVDVARAQRVLLVEPPPADAVLSEAFNRLRAELLLQDFEVVVVRDGASISSQTLESEARAQHAFAAILLERNADGASADVCIADRVTGKTTRRRLAIGDVRQAPRVLAVRAVDLLRSSLRELPPGERPPADVLGVQDEPAAPTIRAFSENVRLFQLRVEGSVLGAPSGVGSAYGASLGFFLAPLDWLRAGVVASGPLLGAHYAAPSGRATIRQELAAARAVVNALPDGELRFGPMLGAGVYHLEARGEVSSATLRARSDGVWSFAACAGADAELRLSEALSLSGSLGALLLTPRPVIAVDRHERALAAPVLLASLGMGVSF